MNKYTYLGCLSLVVIGTFFIGKLQRSSQFYDAGEVEPVMLEMESASSPPHSSNLHVEVRSSKMFAASSTSTGLAHNEEELLPFSREIMEREISLLKKLTEKYGEKLDLDQIADKNFLSEPYAGDEGRRKESILSELFLTSRSLQVYNLKSIECRARHCRLELFYQNKKDVEFALSDVSGAIENGGYQSLFKGARQNTFSRKESIISIYLADNFGSSLYSEEDLK